MDGRIMRHGIINSCHFRDCKTLLVTSLTHVHSAIASTRPLPYFSDLLYFSDCLALDFTLNKCSPATFFIWKKCQLLNHRWRLCLYVAAEGDYTFICVLYWTLQPFHKSFLPQTNWQLANTYVAGLLLRNFGLFRFPLLTNVCRFFVIFRLIHFCWEYVKS